MRTGRASAPTLHLVVDDGEHVIEILVGQVTYGLPAAQLQEQPLSFSARLPAIVIKLVL